jgi:hypothetical protein
VAVAEPTNFSPVLVFATMGTETQPAQKRAIKEQ